MWYNLRVFDQFLPVLEQALVKPVTVYRPAGLTKSGFRQRVYCSIWYWRKQGKALPLVVEEKAKGVVIRHKKAPDALQITTADGRTIWLNGPPPPE